ncbi:hypothetical protein ECG_06178 [Echinococcus granulosus]|nr:hypothetical protein ECG_06179 [Echinococcus granulosus]KAH9280279.1 hypothetical protein ECG_06178 [Echinococcus granulosus]
MSTCDTNHSYTAEMQCFPSKCTTRPHPHSRRVVVVVVVVVQQVDIISTNSGRVVVAIGNRCLQVLSSPTTLPRLFHRNSPHPQFSIIDSPVILPPPPMYQLITPRIRHQIIRGSYSCI